MSGGSEADDGNPFAAPEADLSGGGGIPRTEAEAVRCAHLGAESWIQAIGMQALIGAVYFGTFGAELSLGVGFLGGMRASPLLPLSYFVMSGLGLIVGFGLRKYDPSARILALSGTVLWGTWAVYGMLAGRLSQSVLVCMQAPFAVIFLCTLLNAKARRIFSPEYGEIIAQTPHIRPSLGCLLNVAVFGVFALVMMLVVATIAAR